MGGRTLLRIGAVATHNQSSARSQVGHSACGVTCATHLREHGVKCWAAQRRQLVCYCCAERVSERCIACVAEVGAR